MKPSRDLAEFSWHKRAARMRASLIEAYWLMAEESRKFANEALPIAAEAWDDDNRAA